jgi:hypothetical protein
MVLCRKPFTKRAADLAQRPHPFLAAVPFDCNAARAAERRRGVCRFTSRGERKSQLLVKNIYTFAFTEAPKKPGKSHAQAKTLIFVRDPLPPIQFNSADREFERFLMQTVARYSPFRSTNVFAVLPIRSLYALRNRQYGGGALSRRRLPRR